MAFVRKTYEKPWNDINYQKDVNNSFGHGWTTFNYLEEKTETDLDTQFLAYTSQLDRCLFDKNFSTAADCGAGSGRSTSRLLPHFSLIYALEPSEGAINVLKKKFSSKSQIQILQETVGDNSIPDGSLDFAMSLGVLHHIPNTGEAIKKIYSKLKPGGLFLCYLYYKLDDKPFNYRLLFRVAHVSRWVICYLPFGWRMRISKLIAILVYLPFARISRFYASKGKDVSNIPLHHYADIPFVMLQNDALDRFGTRLEQRFSKKEISKMLGNAGFELSTLKFSDLEPFWTFSVKKP